jgi:tRNA threonylcarbamoyladenosine biosynthesis protein TsaE
LWFRSPSPEATREAARRLAAAIDESGAFISLCGPLGAGKTLFVKGLAEGLGVDPAGVTSPTFAIAAEYRFGADRLLIHADLYRLADAAELEAAGYLDWLEPGAVVAIEWGDRLPDALPADRLDVTISRQEAAEGERSLDATATGPASSALLARWEDELR